MVGPASMLGLHTPTTLQNYLKFDWLLEVQVHHAFAVVAFSGECTFTGPYNSITLETGHMTSHD